MSSITYVIMKMILILAVMFAGYYLTMIMLIYHGKREGWKPELIITVVKLSISILVILVQLFLFSLTPL